MYIISHWRVLSPGVLALCVFGDDDPSHPEEQVRRQECLDAGGTDPINPQPPSATAGDAAEP
jgi:hypothetical protein